MKRTVFSIPKMDCPSEENLIRMALKGSSDIKMLEFDLEGRSLSVVHEGDARAILSDLEPLGFGARISESSELNPEELEDVAALVKELESHPGEARVLKQLLAINLAMFLIEISIGWVVESTGLIADSLDMFADAAVYGISLYAVGKAISHQRRAARISGYFQLGLAGFVLFEVIRRFIYSSEPLALYMIFVSLIALVANVTCLVLISRHRTGGVHMKASWIFSANDVIANTGVIFAGILVYFLDSNLPDLIIGLIIGAVVLRGAFSILKISGERQVSP